jgi:hypothetical protein
MVGFEKGKDSVKVVIPKNPYPKQEEGMNNPDYHIYEKALADVARVNGVGE